LAKQKGLSLTLPLLPQLLESAIVIFNDFFLLLGLVIFYGSRVLSHTQLFSIFPFRVLHSVGIYKNWLSRVAETPNTALWATCLFKIHFQNTECYISV